VVAKAPETLSHNGQFIIQFSLLELPYLFNQVTDWNPSGSRLAWMPTLGFGFGSGSTEYLLKLGGGVNRFADDRAFVFGFERRHYFGSGTFKGIFFWNVMFGTGSHVTVYQMFNLGVGLQIDLSRRFGFYASFGPGFLTTWGGDRPPDHPDANNYDMGFVLVTHFGVQLRI
jgi:hypothetical protein